MPPTLQAPAWYVRGQPRAHHQPNDGTGTDVACTVGAFGLLLLQIWFIEKCRALENEKLALMELLDEANNTIKAKVSTTPSGCQRRHAALATAYGGGPCVVVRAAAHHVTSVSVQDEKIVAYKRSHLELRNLAAEVSKARLATRPRHITTAGTRAAEPVPLHS